MLAYFTITLNHLDHCLPFSYANAHCLLSFISKLAMLWTTCTFSLTSMPCFQRSPMLYCLQCIGCTEPQLTCLARHCHDFLTNHNLCRTIPFPLLSILSSSQYLRVCLYGFNCQLFFNVPHLLSWAAHIYALHALF